jgi:hypothetical protein
MAMLASDFEFRHRSWFILGVFCVGLTCYWIDPQNSGGVVAKVLHSHIALLQPLSLLTSSRTGFLIGVLIVALGAMIRAWGAEAVMIAFPT